MVISFRAFRRNRTASKMEQSTYSIPFCETTWSLHWNLLRLQNRSPSLPGPPVTCIPLPSFLGQHSKGGGNSSQLHHQQKQELGGIYLRQAQSSYNSMPSLRRLVRPTDWETVRSKLKARMVGDGRWCLFLMEKVFVWHFCWSSKSLLQHSRKVIQELKSLLVFRLIASISIQRGAGDRQLLELHAGTQINFNTRPYSPEN